MYLGAGVACAGGQGGHVDQGCICDNSVAVNSVVGRFPMFEGEDVGNIRSRCLFTLLSFRSLHSFPLLPSLTPRRPSPNGAPPMAPTRDGLKAMKRADLQRLCKVRPSCAPSGPTVHNLIFLSPSVQTTTAEPP